jgi:hypothetical protein
MSLYSHEFHNKRVKMLSKKKKKIFTRKMFYILNKIFNKNYNNSKKKKKIDFNI